MKTARDVTYQLVRESGLTTILGEAVGAPVWAAPACECAPFPEDSPAPAASLSRRAELEGEALMGSRTTNPTTDEVREEWKIPLVAERARIVRRAGEILRATRENRDDEGVDFGRYRIFPKLRLLLRDGVKVDIRARAFDVLWVLVQADGDLVSKNQLLDTVWSGVVVEENNLQAQMSAIRRSLGADRGMIRTEFGLGYRLVVEKPKTPRSKAGTSEVKRSTPSSLPLPSTSSLRGADHREIERAFDKSRLVNIPGAGGGGKQRIALELGRRLAEHFQDGVDLAAMAKISEDELVGRALAGGPPIPSPHIEHADPIESVLSGRQPLLIVDNFEHRDGASKTDEV
jgi:DNA-binding winged helix-turn-helix (wHTH) protein